MIIYILTFQQHNKSSVWREIISSPVLTTDNPIISNIAPVATLHCYWILKFLELKIGFSPHSIYKDSKFQSHDFIQKDNNRASEQVSALIKGPIWSILKYGLLNW